MASRWPTRLLSAGLLVWYSRFGTAIRRRPHTPQRILIAHHLLLGDTIMLTPLLKKLRERFPDAEIVMTCRPALAALFAGQPYGVRAIAFNPRDVGTFWNLHRARGFDLALLPTDNRYSWLARALDSRWIVAFESERPSYKDWPVDELRPYPDHTMAFGDLVADGLIDGPSPLPYRTEEWPPPPAAPFALPATPYCLLHVGAGSRLRLWHAQNWRRLTVFLERFGTRAVLSAGPGEQNLIEEIDPENTLISFPGTLSLPQLWRLLSSASAVVCPDTGISHLARLVGVPLVVLYGPGSATLLGGGEFWHNVPDRKVTIPKFPCRDLNVVFGHRLPWLEHCTRTPPQCMEPKCMHALTVEMVIDALRSVTAAPA